MRLRRLRSSWLLGCGAEATYSAAWLNHYSSPRQILFDKLNHWRQLEHGTHRDAERFRILRPQNPHRARNQLEYDARHASACECNDFVAIILI
jgi:hypothetical protein